MKSKPEKDKPAAADAAVLENRLATIPMESVATLARHTALNLGTAVSELEEGISALGDVLPAGHPAQVYLKDAGTALRGLGEASDNLRLVFLCPANCVAKFGLVIESAL